jgi:peptidylprolyl isomerase
VKRALALLLLPVLLLAACGDDDTQTGDPDGSTTSSAGATTSAAPSDLPPGVTVVSVSDDLTAKPAIELEESDTAPTEVIIEDTVVGDGAEVAEGDTVEVQYVGLLTDGTQFDASWDNGAAIEFGLDQVITGWGEGLIGMKEGGRRVLVIPAEKGYGATGQGSIPPNATLVFVVDLVSVVQPPTPGVTVSGVSDDMSAKPEFTLEGSDTAPTEIVTEDVVVGDGEEVPADGDPRVRMQVIEMLTNGSEVASTWEVEAAEFNLSQVIPGFPEGVAGMKVGGRRVIVIPADQAYGAEGTPDGTIPPDATMVYIVDLLEIVDPTAATTSSTAGQ